MRRLGIWLLLLSALLACTERTPELRNSWARPWIVADARPLLADIRLARPSEGAREAVVVPGAEAATETAQPTPAIIVDAPEAVRPVIDWRNPLEGWLTVDAYLASRQQAPDGDTAHGLLMLSLALNDTLHAAATARAAGLAISDEVALAAAATSVLPVSRGLAGRGASNFAAEALAEVPVDAATRLASRQLGISVAGVVRERLAQAEALIGEANAIKVPPASFANDAVPESEQLAVLAVLPASETDKAGLLARYGSAAPALPFRWLALAGEHAAVVELESMERAGLYAMLAVAMADSAAICMARTDLFASVGPAAWLIEAQPAWEPLVPAPAGSRVARSCMSAAAAEILAVRFRAASDGFAAMAAEAGTAAVAAGWLWPAEDSAAQELGRAVARQILAARLQASGDLR